MCVILLLTPLSHSASPELVELDSCTEEDDVENVAVNFEEIAASHNIQPSRVSVERIQLTEQVLLHISYIQAPVCSFKKGRKYT